MVSVTTKGRRITAIAINSDRTLLAFTEFGDRPLVIVYDLENKKRLKLIIWFVVKSLYGMHIKKLFNKRQLFNEIWKELDWNVSLMKRIGALDVMILLKDKLRSLDSWN